MTTHAHWDHFGNHGEFQSIAIHKEDAEWLCDGIQGLSIEQVRTEVIRDLSKLLTKDFSIDNYRIYTGSPTLLLHDESIIDLGNHELVVIHSHGHVCILDKKTHFLFTDVLLYYDAPIYACYPSTSPSDLV